MNCFKLWYSWQCLCYTVIKIPSFKFLPMSHREGGVILVLYSIYSVQLYIVSNELHVMVPFICHEIQTVSVLTSNKLYRATLCTGEVWIPIYGSDSSIITITWVRNGVYQLSPAQCLIIHQQSTTVSNFHLIVQCR